MKRLLRHRQTKGAAKRIADEVFIRTQRKITVMEVKGAKNALMAKFRTILKHKLS
jgi:predicted acetyltransferase